MAQACDKRIREAARGFTNAVPVMATKIGTMWAEVARKAGVDVVALEREVRAHDATSGSWSSSPFDHAEFVLEKFRAEGMTCRGLADALYLAGCPAALKIFLEIPGVVVVERERGPSHASLVPPTRGLPELIHLAHAFIPEALSPPISAVAARRPVTLVEEYPQYFGYPDRADDPYAGNEYRRPRKAHAWTEADFNREDRLGRARQDPVGGPPSYTVHAAVADLDQQALRGWFKAHADDLVRARSARGLYDDFEAETGISYEDAVAQGAIAQGGTVDARSLLELFFFNILIHTTVKVANLRDCLQKDAPAAANALADL